MKRGSLLDLSKIARRGVNKISEFRNRGFERCIEPGRWPIAIFSQNLPLPSCRGAVASGKYC
jgi:hypothetical protein